MRKRACIEDLVLGQRYIHSNGWHHECEYGDIWYVGTSYNKYGDVVYCFCEQEVEFPDGYDGDAAFLSYPGGPVFEAYEIEHGDIAIA